MRRIHFVWGVAVAIALFAICFTCCKSDPPTADPCDGVVCSSEGSCVTDGVSPYCACNDGFHPEGLGCVPNDEADPCLGVDCTGHGRCEVTSESLPRCECDSPYENVGASTLCLNITGEPAGDAGADASDSDIGDTDSDTDDPPCELGVTRSCSCEGEAEGLQACGEDGWNACVCDEPPCSNGDTRVCRCPDDTTSYQMCMEPVWLDCVCIDPPECESDERRDCTCSDSATGEQICDFGEWGECVCAFVGDVCSSQPECIGGEQEMLCILQHEGDTYGICTIPCVDWTVCTELDDWYSCCDIAEAGAACLPDDWECDPV